MADDRNRLNVIRSSEALKSGLYAGAVLSELDAMEDLDQERVATDVKIGTGPGTPEWEWRTATLRWSVPTQGQQVVLYALNPTQTRVLNLVRALLVVLLAASLVVMVWSGKAGQLKRKRNVPQQPDAVGAAILAAALGIGTLSLSTDGAATEGDPTGLFPSAEMLRELGEHLTKPPACAPHCASVSQGWLRVSTEDGKERLSLRLAVQAQDATVIPILAGANGWRIDSVAVNGMEQSALVAGGTTWTRVDKGVSMVDYSGPLPKEGRVTLQLPLAPKLLDVVEPGGWSVDGIDAAGVTAGGISLHRAMEAGEEPAGPQGAQMPPFVRIERLISIGVDWEISHRALRIAPDSGPVVVRFPLLEGEEVVSEVVAVENGEAVVTFAEGEKEKRWTSRLEVMETIRLMASLSPTLIETWRLKVSDLWHAETLGLKETVLGEGGLREWRPWAGESLEIDVTRPIGLDARTLTIESALLEGVQGKQASEYTLTLQMRASQGGTHRMAIPQSAQLLEVTLNGNRHQMQSEDGVLRINLGPGTQRLVIRWKEPLEIGRQYTTPKVDLGLDAVNAQIALRVSPERWLLWAQGPVMGPAVRMWSQLALALVVVGLIAWRAKDLPTRLLAVLVFSIGFTQATEQFTYIAIATGLFWAKRYQSTASYRVYNLMQTGLALVAFLWAIMLLDGVRQGLVGLPEMRIAGNGSSGSALRWYQDRTEGTWMPQATVASVGLGYYRLLMLAWALLVAVYATTYGRWMWNIWKRPEIFRAKP